MLELKKYMADLPDVGMTIEFWAASLSKAEEKMMKLGKQFIGLREIEEDNSNEQ